LVDLKCGEVVTEFFQATLALFGRDGFGALARWHAPDPAIVSTICKPRSQHGVEPTLSDDAIVGSVGRLEALKGVFVFDPLALWEGEVLGEFDRKPGRQGGGCFRGGIRGIGRRRSPGRIGRFINEWVFGHVVVAPFASLIRGPG
jgi:hypothetical protein